MGHFDQFQLGFFDEHFSFIHGYLNMSDVVHKWLAMIRKTLVNMSNVVLKQLRSTVSQVCTCASPARGRYLKITCTTVLQYHYQSYKNILYSVK